MSCPVCSGRTTIAKRAKRAAGEHCVQCGFEGALYHFRGGPVCQECIREAVELEQVQREAERAKALTCTICGAESQALCMVGDMRMCPACAEVLIKQAEAKARRDRAISEPGEPKLEEVSGVYICAACLDGKGGECHTPGCLFWMCTAPDIPLRDRIVDHGGSIITDRPEGSHAPRPTTIREQPIIDLPQEEWERAAVSASDRLAKERGER